MPDQRITMNIDADLWREVAIEAAKQVATKREIVEQALKQFLEKGSE